MTAAQKIGHERWIFSRLCAAAGLEVADGTVRPGEDPPDVRADLNGYGQTAFELVRLNAPEDLEYKSQLPWAQRLFNASFVALEAARRAALTAKFADCWITISFKSNQPKERKEALAYLWTLLEELPANTAHEVDLRSVNAPEALDTLWLTHTQDTDGPQLRCFGSRGEYPLNLEKLREKLTTPYDGSERLELLAYVEAGEIAFLGAIERIAELVADLLPQSSFHTVWVYEELLDRVVFAVCRTRSD